ncbi:serine/arginine repetitive matrix protein 4 isoform X2 [Phyllopteryx taeniolatus]|uniref:serine/arginine repetitive matrix protein 4 isoform X2 n=1 Tax=Phyllopteryx taeniolatus TaxID=161469 RepID=UPI002AD59AA5|nr:serine/arginine repetitive matrix protein 4 isoform X2 [Phyllopteryx taeniolatus]
MRTAGSVQPAAESRENADVLHQKQLFEKFWKGTFKAVATPRPESVIVASITARTRLTRPETKAERAPDDHQTDEMAADPKPRDDADSTVPPIGRKKHHRHRHRRRRSRRRSRRAKSASFGEELSLQPKAKKKKKRKSERKRPRRRLPSRSLSPLRKKKKKKKKSSKKNKRHRYTTKKSKHGSSRRKRKKKDERKRKKSSRTGRRGKRRHGRSASDCPPSAEDRQTAYKKETRPTSEAKWTSGGGGAAKSVLPSASMFSSELFRGRACRRAERPHDCDSGNDTSSPPSGKSSVADESDGPQPRADDASDSGNSPSSYASGGEDGSSAGALPKREHEALGYRLDAPRSPQTSSRGRPSTEWRRGLRRSRSSGSSRYMGRRSPSSSLSSASSYSYSHSPSFSTDLRRRRGSLSSVSSRGSYSRHRQRRLRSRERASSSRETDVEHKVSRKRWRRKSYSPMRKRRRYSPSHLEARRITSARKRPVPYFRRSASPSWSSRSNPSSRYRSRARSSSSSSSCGSVSRGSSWSFGARCRSASRY